VFGAGVLWHLIRRGRRYDAVHTCSFPYFSLLAAGLVRLRWSYRLVVDWFEVWSRSYWREYLGRIGGDVGWLVQRACARIPQHAFCFSRLYAARLREEGLKGEITALAGAYDGPSEPRLTEGSDSLVLFAGRHIPEKCVPAIPPALVKAREQVPQLRAAILGDGPDRPEVIRLVDELGLQEIVEVPGFVATERVQELMAGAMCVVLPSRREGYGLVVIEAAACGTPSVVVSAPDNAATELVVDGENGFIAASASPEDLAAAIVRVSRAGTALRRSTAGWFAANARRLGIDGSLEAVARSYRS
jgi:glycosyltransferase involved in cell wall biosynthesis